ncbi:MAG: hypothetical protein Ct9H300mP6_12570 [Gammaproteobacteria bacterium]|nr:MAG: hypothetical protein Ct9H300mP6_12570 [Gammaproteobacteria bacterium]
MEHEEPHHNVAFECFHYGRTLAVLPMIGNFSSIVITIASDKANEILNLLTQILTLISSNDLTNALEDESFK